MQNRGLYILVPNLKCIYCMDFWEGGAKFRECLTGIPSLLRSTVRLPCNSSCEATVRKRRWIGTPDDTSLWLGIPPFRERKWLMLMLQKLINDYKEWPLRSGTMFWWLDLWSSSILPFLPYSNQPKQNWANIGKTKSKSSKNLLCGDIGCRTGNGIMHCRPFSPFSISCATSYIPTR